MADHLDLLLGNTEVSRLADERPGDAAHQPSRDGCTDRTAQHRTDHDADRAARDSAAPGREVLVFLDVDLALLILGDQNSVFDLDQMILLGLLHALDGCLGLIFARKDDDCDRCTHGVLLIP